MAKAKSKVVKNLGTLWKVYGKNITPIKIIDIKQTGILYPDTPLYRYYLDGDPDNIVLEKGQSDIKIGRRFFTLCKENAINKTKQKK